MVEVEEESTRLTRAASVRGFDKSRKFILASEMLKEQGIQCGGQVRQILFIIFTHLRRRVKEQRIQRAAGRSALTVHVNSFSSDISSTCSLLQSKPPIT